MANRNHEHKKFFQGAFRLFTEAAEKGFGDKREVVKHFNPADVPHLSDKAVGERRKLYLQLLHEIKKEALLARDVSFLNKVADFSRAAKCRSCKQPDNL